MLPPRTTGWAGSAASRAAVSDDVVVLPFVPVTPIVGQGHIRRTRSVSLTRAGTPPGSRRCARDDGSQGRPEPRLGRGEVRVDARGSRDQVGPGPGRRGLDRPARARSSTGRPPSDSIAGASSAGRPAVVDGDPRAGVGEEAGQGDAAPGQTQHRHRPCRRGRRRGRRPPSGGRVRRRGPPWPAYLRDRGDEERHPEHAGQSARRSRSAS